VPANSTGPFPYFKGVEPIGGGVEQYFSLFDSFVAGLREFDGVENAPVSKEIAAQPTRYLPTSCLALSTPVASALVSGFPSIKAPQPAFERCPA
jgi:hypothetical protein